MPVQLTKSTHNVYEFVIKKYNWLYGRRRHKCFLIILYIVILFWIIAVILIQVTKEPVYNIFEVQESSRKILRAIGGHGLTSVNFEDRTAIRDASFQKLAYKDSPSIYDMTIMTALDSLRFTSNPSLPSVDCLAVVHGDEEAVVNTQLVALTHKRRRRKIKQQNVTNIEDEDDSIEMSKNCKEFLTKRQYFTIPLTSEEKAYPIAYIITIHRKFSMFERLLRSIYQPQNIYCIHVDKKSPTSFIDSIQTFARCFDNVFVASRLTEVHYSHWSRVQADLNCLQDLVERKTEVPWKYVINLCGQDFPLKTNLEIVRSLKSLHGFNNLETIHPPGFKKVRFMNHFQLPHNPKHEYIIMQRTHVTKSPPPLETSIFVGSAYYVLKRSAVEFLLLDKRIKSFFNWSQDAFSPDEHVWATLQRWYPTFPGSFSPSSKYDQNELQSITRLVKWGGMDPSVYSKCGGHYSRGVCIYGSSDLHWLLQQHHLFANKFDNAVDAYAIECLDDWLRNKTILQTKHYITNGYL